jgi:hypothetical protein
MSEIDLRRALKMHSNPALARFRAEVAQLGTSALIVLLTKPDGLLDRFLVPEDLDDDISDDTKATLAAAHFEICDELDRRTPPIAQVAGQVTVDAVVVVGADGRPVRP